MADHTSRSSVNWRQAAGEALLILVGVGVALLGQAWWEYRGDREVEQHLLSGIQADLSRDTADALRVVSAARARIAGAERLLQLIQDPNAGILPPPPGWLPGDPTLQRQAFVLALAEYDIERVAPERALQMVASSHAIQTLDLSNASYSEATATGQLDVIRDLNLRAQIVDYYSRGNRLSRTGGTRAEAHWQRFREVLADAGLSAAGGESDQRILTVLRSAPTLVAELKNARDLAIGTARAHPPLIAMAEALIVRLERESSP